MSAGAQQYVKVSTDCIIQWKRSRPWRWKQVPPQLWQLHTVTYAEDEAVRVLHINTSEPKINLPFTQSFS